MKGVIMLSDIILVIVGSLAHACDVNHGWLASRF
jgi:hypothetical protein